MTGSDDLTSRSARFGLRGSRAPAFSLLELMIGIVILGLGMVMVATMFPVAWGRARTLGEFTVQRAITGNAHAAVSSLVRVAGPSRIASSFESDLLYRPLPTDPNVPDLTQFPIAECPAFPSDTFVHALNLENIQIADRRFVVENLWLRDGGELQRAESEFVDGPVIEHSFFRKRVSFHERIYPPMSVRDKVDLITGEFTGDDDRWDDALATRRYGWSVFYRLREVVEPGDAGAPGTPRSFDMYYVMLRRGQSSFHYARQATDPGFLPDPCDLTGPGVDLAAMESDRDVMFPVPWRVQVEFPPSILCGVAPTGIPTEIEIPPAGVSAKTGTMLIQMFQRGTRFIDNLNGQVYRVNDRRVSTDLKKATLTLDREVLCDDLDISPENDSLCGPCVVGTIIPAELLRTVWVFPPPVQPRTTDGDAPVFSGSPPAIAIDVRTLSVVPTS